ncbi:hypothetical protein Pcinc_006103 [Petrolisthes cinctipes]|uniref:Uncharacterized protein n=1 Tax=Petrolisthes cinctipes TaxID=88211 RepID=A0AAE1GDP5_PETCI|nr:hypothetical protein Pcinc_006103 [Petrolisthes cinctipes]
MRSNPDTSQVALDRAERYDRGLGRRILAEILTNGIADTSIDITTSTSHGSNTVTHSNSTTSIPEQTTTALQMIDDENGISDFSISAVTST